MTLSLDNVSLGFFGKNKVIEVTDDALDEINKCWIFGKIKRYMPLLINTADALIRHK